jgi:hypothetical protein
MAYVVSHQLGFAHGSVHVAFVVEKVAMGQIFLRVLHFSPVNIIPPWLHIHLSSSGGLLMATAQQQSQPINTYNT